MYCVQCGVQLTEDTRACPLCQTPVYYPQQKPGEGPGLYPTGTMPVVPGRSLAKPGILTLAWILFALIVVLCDQQITGRITWSGYVLGGLLVTYVIFLLPAWFKRPEPAVFVPCGFAAVILYLLYICLATGGTWFLRFAFPVTGGMGLIVTAMATLLRYLRRGRLYIIGGTCVAIGGFMLLTEWLLSNAFPMIRFTGWAWYPLAVLVLLGGFLIFLGICRPAREMMERKFFI